MESLNILRNDEKKIYPILFFIVLLIGLVLRIYALGRFSLWYDEAAALLNAENLKNMIAKLGKFNINYPSILYGFFISYWQRIGKDEVTLRMSSVIFAMFTILIIYGLGKILFNKKTGLLASFLLAISPFHIYYSRELRAYSLMVLLSVMAVYFLVMALRKNKFIFWLSYIILNILNIYTHCMASYVLLAEIIFFMVYFNRYSHMLKRWILSNSLIFLFLIPWLINVIFILEKILLGNYYPWMVAWSTPVSLKNLFYIFANFSIGYNANMIMYALITVLFFILIILGIIKTEKKEESILSLSCFLVPVLSMFIFSKFKPCFMDRYVIPSVIFYYFLIAQGIAKLKVKHMLGVMGIIIVVVVIGLNNYYQEYFPYEFKNCRGVTEKTNYRDAANYIMEHFHDGDVIFHSSENSIFPFKYYFGIKPKDSNLRKISTGVMLNFSKKSNELLPFDHIEEGTMSIDKSSEISIENQKRIWFVFSGWFWEKTLMSNSDASKKLKWLKKNYETKEARLFSDIIIFLFERKRI